MRRMVMMSGAAIALLTACGGDAQPGNAAEPAIAATGVGEPQKKPRPKVAPTRNPAAEMAADWAAFDEGGVPGCYNAAQLSAYQQGVMRRMGGEPCKDTAPTRQTGAIEVEPAIMPAPPPTLSSTENAGPWPVGLWVPSKSGCRDGSPSISIRKDGSYARSSDAGGWRIAGGQIVLTYADVGPMATAGEERFAPKVEKKAPIAKLSASRMTYAGSEWTLCSRNPDAFFQ